MHDYYQKRNRETGQVEPVDPNRDIGSRLRRIPGTRIYVKIIDFELWRGLRDWLRRVLRR